MNLFRLVQAAGMLASFAGGLTSCLNAPSYPDTPNISFGDIRLQRFTTSNGTVDSVFITVNFEDGDGDLGLTYAESTNPPYGSPGNTSGVAAVISRNYYASPFVKNSAGGFDSLRSLANRRYIPVNYLYSTFDHLSTTTDSRKSPLKGTLTRRYGFQPNLPFVSGQEVKFRVSLFDRAMHHSNEIETPTVTFP